MESKITCRLLGHFSLLTRLFSHLLSVMLEALKMDKSPHCAETTHALRLHSIIRYYI